MPHHQPSLYAASIVVLAVVAGCARVPAPVKPPSPPAPERKAAAPKSNLLGFEATAYSIDGKTASGKMARPGIVAADPNVLPLGSRIRVHDAGAYSGEYEVADTGRAIKGREIDIYIEKQSEAVRFGRRQVRVEVLD
jgi:3D (Asp-Asp-Asp) domain-containing protein